VSIPSKRMPSPLCQVLRLGTGRSIGGLLPRPAVTMRSDTLESFTSRCLPSNRTGRDMRSGVISDAHNHLDTVHEVVEPFVDAVRSRA
jgi:hypothetical protein